MFEQKNKSFSELYLGTPLYMTLLVHLFLYNIVQDSTFFLLYITAFPVDNFRQIADGLEEVFLISFN
jgi:hypothetical protein